MCASDCIYLLLVSYLLGSIPFGVVMARAFGLPDPRTIGSGNIGATNMLRSGRKGAALMTLILDAAKGAAAVWIGRLFFEATPVMATVAVMMATLGHIYSPWLKFKGGKGVATTLGGMLALSPIIGGMVCVIWLLVFVSTGISSLSAVIALIFLPLIGWWEFDSLSVVVMALTSTIVVFKHLPNVERFIRGEEKSFFAKAKEGT